MRKDSDAPISISWKLQATSCGKPWPPYSVGPVMLAQPLSTYCL